MVAGAPSLTQACAAITACRAALRAGSSSFHVASLLLPRRVRRPASALYAFCRLADDAVDLGEDKRLAVMQLQARLDALGRGEMPVGGVDYAFAAVAAHYGIPLALPRALVEGFAWDAEQRRYDTLKEVLDYAARVAGAVGAMMALVMGVRDREGLARACELGVAMQLSNIARDVGEDARMGRLYLPRDWMREEGLEPDAWLREPRFSPALGRVVQRLLRAADALYAQSRAGVRQLPLDCRTGIHAARLVYSAIGDRVLGNGADSVSSRAHVPNRDKLALLGRAALQAWSGAGMAAPGAPDARALAANQFLIDAVLHADAAQAAGALPWWRIGQRMDDRAAWVADLFVRLGSQERLAVSRQALR